jgi:hypothetical protein
VNQFHPGEAVHVYMTSCASSSGGIVDPTPLYLTYWTPAGRVTVATTSAAILSGGAVGQWYAEIVPTTSEVGIWDYRWSSTGTYRLSQWQSFRVIDPPRST